MALKKCKECGTEISTSAEACPNCGKRCSRFNSRTMRDLLVIGILVWIAFEHFKTEGPAPVTSRFSISSETGKASGIYSTPEGKSAIPQQQITFCETIDNYRQLYFNEYHKDKYPDQKKNLEAIFNARTSKLMEILGDGEIKGWQGVIRTITVEEGEGAWVEVNMPCNTRLLSEDDLVIKVGTPLFESLTKYHAKSLISFTGNFLIHPENSSHHQANQTHYEELSTTPIGSIDSPRFVFRFREIAD